MENIGRPRSRACTLFAAKKDHAFEWLDRAYQARDQDLYLIKGDPLLKNLEGDPRHKALLRKMNLPE